VRLGRREHRWLYGGCLGIDSRILCEPDPVDVGFACKRLILSVTVLGLRQVFESHCLILTNDEEQCGHRTTRADPEGLL